MGMGQTIDINEFIKQAEKAIANGIATLDASAKVPKNQISLTAGDVGAIATGGEAGTALKLTTPRTISASGDAVYSVSFDGSANVSGAITLASVNGNVGNFGSATQIPVIVVDSKGRITAISIQSGAFLPLSGGSLTGALTSNSPISTTNATASTSPTTGASVVAGGQGIGGDQHIGGFTSFGGTASGHPLKKEKLIEGFTPSIQGGTNAVLHGLNSLKIIGVSFIVDWTGAGGIIPSGYDLEGLYDVLWGMDASNFYVMTKAGASANVLNKNFRALISYTA